jgi:hypothetical protein
MRGYKLKFRDTELSRTQVKNNILAVYNAAEKDSYAALTWYNSAHEFADRELQCFGVNMAQAVGVLAALSPLKTWEQNKLLAIRFCRFGDRKGHMGNLVKKADAILKLESPSVDDVVEILNGQKIVAFFMNIYYPNKDIAVTIDRHAFNIAVHGAKYMRAEEDEQQMSRKQFEFLVHCYKWAAESIGISAVQLQAVTWEHYRKNYKKK